MKRRKTRGLGSYPGTDDDLYTAPEVAAFCKVDLKTIHNWVERGQVQFFRTPGRHLRFRRADVMEFLKRYSYPVPPELRPRKPRIYVLEADPEACALLERMLSQQFEVAGFQTAMDVLLKAGAVPPEAIIANRDARQVDIDELRKAIARNPSTESCRVLTYATRDLPQGDHSGAGVASLMDRPGFKELRVFVETSGKH